MHTYKVEPDFKITILYNNKVVSQSGAPYASKEEAEADAQILCDQINSEPYVTAGFVYGMDLDAPENAEIKKKLFELKNKA